MKWHKGATVLEALDLLEPQSADVDLPLRFCVQDVYRFDERRIIASVALAHRIHPEPAQTPHS